MCILNQTRNRLHEQKRLLENNYPYAYQLLKVLEGRENKIFNHPLTVFLTDENNHDISDEQLIIARNRFYVEDRFF
jgi:hypothetical protein